MYCKKCGKELDNNALFCPSCGEAVENEASAAKQGGGKSKALIGIIAAILVIVLVIVGVSVSKGSEEGEKDPMNDEAQTIQGIDVRTIYLPEHSVDISIDDAFGGCMYDIVWENYVENGNTYVKGEGKYSLSDETVKTITVILLKEEDEFKVDSAFVDEGKIEPADHLLKVIYSASASKQPDVLGDWLSPDNWSSPGEEEESNQPASNASNGVMNDAAQVMVNLLYDAVFNWDNSSVSLYSLYNEGCGAYEYALGDANGDGRGDAILKLDHSVGLLIVYSVDGLYYGKTIPAESVSGLDWHKLDYIPSQGWKLYDNYLSGFNVQATFY